MGTLFHVNSTTTIKYVSFHVGEPVEGLCNGTWHSAVILGHNKDSSFKVAWNERGSCSMVKASHDLRPIAVGSKYSQENTFVQYAGPGFSCCRDGVVLDTTFPASTVDCAAVCAVMNACSFYSEGKSRHA